MNYETMTARELLHYLDLYSNDPVVRRLANMIDSMFAELEQAGMDPKTRMFGSGWEDQSPADYIISLQRDLQLAQDELESVKYKLEEAETELDELKTRSIMDFVQEVWQEKRTASFKVSEAMNEVAQVKEQNAKLREQIDMWGRLNKV